MRPSRFSRFAAAGLALTLITAACASDDTTSRRDDPDEIVDLSDLELTSGLAAFDDCDGLLSHLRTEGAERVGPWGLNHGGYYGGPVIMEGDVVMDVEESMGADDAATDASDGGSFDRNSAGDAAAPALQEGEDFSGTNVQERGVDEPDIVKTDGERIFTVTNGTLTIVDTNDGNPRVLGKVDVGWDVSDMLIHGDRILVFGHGWYDVGIPMPVDGVARGAVAEPAPAAVAVDDVAIDIDVEEEGVDAEASFADEAEVEIAPVDRIIEPVPPIPGWQGPQTRIIDLDISDTSNPRIDGELHIAGRHLSARMVDGVVRLAVQSEIAQLPFVFPSNGASEEAAERFNRQVIEDSVVTDWLPSYQILSGGDVVDSGQLSRCDATHAPAEFAGFGSLSVVSIDMDDPLTALESSSVLASGETVYASTDTMWLATTEWVDWEALDTDARIARERNFSTQIHGFDITGSRAEYLASGVVRGHMLNQFSMSEVDGVLRVATTDGTTWGATADSESFITTFRIRDKQLRKIGQVGNLGKGERIFAVRFVGSTAYVVTFRQTDPFYTVDLSDPADPKVLGELKITGYSGQLHPIGNDLVLGIGQEATEEGFTTGAKLTVFDVSDLSDPVDLDTWTLDNSWTDAEWSHHAFLWWAPEDLAVFPVQNWQEQFWGAIAFRIDPDSGSITEAGRISHEPDGTKPGTTECIVMRPEDLEEYRGGRGELAAMAEELFWISQEGGQVQVCDDGETGAAGMYCDRLEWLDTSEVGITGTVEMCWPEGPSGDPIMRTLVTGGDTLWSLSQDRLQANDLFELTPGEFVTLR